MGTRDRNNSLPNSNDQSIFLIIQLPDPTTTDLSNPANRNMYTISLPWELWPDEINPQPPCDPTREGWCPKEGTPLPPSG